MRLIFGIDALHPPLTGIGRYSFELIQRLRRSGQIEDILLTTGLRIQAELPNLEYLASADTPRLGFRRVASAASAGLRRRFCSARLNRLSDYVCHGPNFVSPRTGVANRNVITVHDLSVYHYPEFHPPRRVRHMRKLLPASVEQAARVITVSTSIAAELKTRFSLSDEQIRVIPLGVAACFTSQIDLATAAEDNDLLTDYGLNDRPYFLFVNGSDPRKNLDRCLQAFEIFRAEHGEDWQLVITGAQQPIKPDSKPGSRWLGHPSDRRLTALYRGAAGLVFPSIYEGFGLPVVEALAVGTPVLISEDPALQEFSILPGVVSASAREQTSLVSGLEALANSAVGEQARSGAPMVADRYSWDACVAATLACYAQLAGCE